MNRGTNTEVRFHWYEVSDDTPALGFPTAFVNLEFEETAAWIQDPIGMVWSARRRTTLAVAPPGLASDHVCGTPDDFQFGGTLNTELPEVKYGSYGFPLCCNPPRRARGGAASGGTSHPTIEPAVTWGATCCDSGAFVAGTTYTGSFATVDLDAHWYRFEGLAAGTYELTTGGPGPPAIPFIGIGFERPTCVDDGSLNVVDVFMGNNSSFTLAGLGVFCLAVVRQVGGQTGDYSFSVS